LQAIWDFSLAILQLTIWLAILASSLAESTSQVGRKAVGHSFLSLSEKNLHVCFCLLGCQCDHRHSWSSQLQTKPRRLGDFC
jgi:hypothetical protein